MNSQQLTRLLVITVIAATVVMGMGPAATAADVDSSGPFDVVFLIDGSPSMEENASATTDMSVEFARDIAEKRPDSRFAVLVYTDHRRTSLHREFTSDIDDLEAGVSSISYGRNSTENATGAILRVLDGDLEPVMSFQESATPLLVVVTDEDDDGYCTVGQEAIESLDRQGGVLVSVAPDQPFDPGQPEPDCLTDDTENDLDTIATEQVATGYWTELSSPDFSPVLDDIPESTPPPTETQPDTGAYTRDLDPAEFEIINRSVEPTIATPGQSVSVQVVVENQGELTDDYVAILSNDTEVLLNDSVSLGPGEAHRFEWNVTLATTGNTTFYVNDSVVGTVEVSSESDGNVTTGTATETEDESTTTSAATESGSDERSTAVETTLASESGPDESAGQPTTAAGLGYPAIIGLSAVGVLTLVLLRRARREL